MLTPLLHTMSAPLAFLSLSPLALTWTHTPHPFLWEFVKGSNIGIRWYGLAYVLAFLGGAWLVARYAKANPPRSLLPADKVWDLTIALVVGVFVGARVGYFVFYTPGELIRDPLALIRFWDGGGLSGMSSHGGFIGVVIALVWFAWRNKIPFLHLGDLIASVASLGFLLGRLANFNNGELWGNPTHSTWGVIFESTGGGPDPRHPSQLYQAALEGGLLLAYMQWRAWRTDVIRAQPGRLAGEYLALYAIFRAICEYFREPDRLARDALGNEVPSLLFGLMSRGTFYSLFLLLAGLALIAWSIRKSQKTPAQKIP